MPRTCYVMEEKWDNLIVLDACRYDIFSTLCKDFLQGKLEKVDSTGSCTIEWCKKSFKDYYDDVVYISATPIINSKMEFKGFNAKKHFYKVIDLWDFGWDENLGTVPPKKVNETVIFYKKLYPDKRFIIHYMQPHTPYLYLKIRPKEYLHPNLNIHHGLPVRQKGMSNINERMRKWFVRGRWLFVKSLAFFPKKFGFFGGNPSWRISEFLHFPPLTPMDYVRRKLGNKGLHEAYVTNLKIVMEFVKNLVKILHGVTVITADHGELLGEDNFYSHPCGSLKTHLREIPWFTIINSMDKSAP